MDIVIGVVLGLMAFIGFFAIWVIVQYGKGMGR